jgi:hypothetical protein
MMEPPTLPGSNNHDVEGDNGKNDYCTIVIIFVSVWGQFPFMVASHCLRSRFADNRTMVLGMVGVQERFH